MDSGAEGHMGLPRWFSTNIESVGFSENRVIAIGHGQCRGHNGACREEDVFVLDIHTGETTSGPNCPDIAHGLLDGSGGQAGVLGEQFPLVGVVSE